MDIKELTVEFIAEALEKQACWDVLNAHLYDFCKKYPTHVEVNVILAKIVIIGRVYSATLERRRDQDSNKVAGQGTNKGKLKGDDFLLDAAKKIKHAKLDELFSKMRSGSESRTSALEVHKEVMELFATISGERKRSLASKYLHFHFPNIFYLFDTRAVGASKRLSKCPVTIKVDGDAKHDQDYLKHWERCDELQNAASELIKKPIDPRQLDKILLHNASKFEQQVRVT